nr:N-acetyltransferase ESCO1 isoform X1 [Pogona vitticeps]XP_020641360.1 N-acetyltransferase ESCO1 isoform X1 [Pogona vitticeps]XP_020641361.1 N-acetyltransferase ESCO1 isoform X1 [Pogona vitticeps]XP_020641362.1 N-acetyltransferase ESCO1 isoform X1 [Pogona vitticeps]
MAAQKRKSVLVEPPAKRRKLDKTSKLVATSKERKLIDIKHVSNKSAKLRKDMHKISSKSRRSSVSKSINRSSVPSSQSKQSQKRSKQTLNELKKKTLKTICMKRSSLKSLGKLSPMKTSPRSSKISQGNHRNSTKCSSKICYRGKGKPNVKSKTSHENKKQKKPSVDNNKRSGGVLHNSHSTLHLKTTQKNQCSVTKSMKENSKKDRTTENGKLLRSSSTNIKIQKSKNSCPKKPAFQSPEPTPTETDEKACDSHQRKMTTRSEGAKSNRGPVPARQEQLRFQKTKELSQEERGHDFPESQYPALDHEPQTRRSLRLQQSFNVPTESVCNRSRKKECISLTKHCPQIKKPVPHIKHEKPKPVQQKTEQLSMMNEGRNKRKEILNIEKTGHLKGKKQVVALTTSDLTTPYNKDKESRNIDSHLQESEKEPVSPISCSLTSTCSVISKEKESVHRNGKSRVKAKRVLPALVTPKPVDHPEEVMKSKKISILELCEEIAGEIESDTVEVKRESPSTECGKEEEKDNVAAAELPQAVVSAEEGTNRNSQCKRFFPSKKGVPIKCTVNGRHSTGNKNSKWTNIKLKKVNHVSQSISNSSSTPKSVFLKCSIPEQQEVGAAELHLPEAEKKSIRSQNNSSTVYGQKLNATSFEGTLTKDKTSPAGQPIQTTENGLFEGKHCSEPTTDENFNLHLESSPENTPMKIIATQPSTKELKKDVAEVKSQDPTPKQLVRTLFPDKTSGTNDSRACLSLTSKCGNFPSEEHIQKLKEAAKDSDKQLTIDAGQKRFGAISCNVCGMFYTAANPEDETQHLLFHNQFISAVKYVGWKKERILAEYPDGKIIMVLPDDPKYALRKVDEIREMVDNDLGFQQAPLTCSRTKTLLFISNDKKVTGCLIAEHIQWGYRVIEEKIPEVSTENEKLTFERQKAWCCSTSPEPAICGISRIWVFNLMRRKKIASRMLECLRSNFIYGSYLSKEEIAFSDPTPDGKLFATQYFGTSQFLVYNFISGQQPA